MKSNPILAGAAVAGLLSGMFAIQTNASTSSQTQVQAGTAMHTLLADENSCKGTNSCKGKGNCKSGDNGCKGKNSCKGKGGCSGKTI